MSTRQYIGARYVPKFYEGSNGNQWDGSGVPYESLTIVTYLGNTYTSKKAVPIGIDITNTAYWVMTGAYNAQVAEYVAEVKALARNFNRKYIFLGDSFMTGYIDGTSYNTGFAELACNNCGLTIDTNAFIAAADGAGYNNGQLLSTLVNIASSIDDPEDITDIYIIAGTNDVGQNPTTAMGTLLNYCRTTYPNAEISIGYDVFPITATSNVSLVRTTREYIKNACANNGVRYLSGFSWCLDEGCRTAYGHHPNTSGQNRLAKCLTEYIKNGVYEESNTETIPYTPLTSSGYNPTIRSSINNGVGTFENEVQTWIAEGFGTAIAGSTWTKIGTITPGNVRSVPPFSLEALVKHSDNSVEYVGLNMRVNNADIEISVLKPTETISNITSIAFGSFCFTYAR